MLLVILPPVIDAMKVLEKISEVRLILANHKKQGINIGLVPTMGALHAGHMALVDASKKENDFTVATIFINPTQFNNSADFEKYPISMESDLEMLEKAGVDLVFHPSVEEMYGDQHVMSFEFGSLNQMMEGQFRPGHFNGVALVVSKLFNIVKPDRAYFGQKDLQQFQIINLLNSELCFGIELRLIPTVRETNGLAMSSRNKRLDNEGLNTAALIYTQLCEATENLKSGIPVLEVKERVINTFAMNSKIQLEYIEIVDPETLRILDSVDEVNELAICIACYVDSIRLIDNTLLKLH